MLLKRDEFSSLLLSVVAVWEENVPTFNEIDAKFGDGDHGVTIGKIAKVFKEGVANWDGQPFKGFLRQLAMGVMGVGGGSAGPLYGTLVDGLADPLADDAEQIDAADLKAMLAASLKAMQSITKAQVGDKTMMDALIPAVAAAEECGSDIPEILAQASTAAAEGAEATAGMVSKFGRARSYGERTLGTPDAGALSTALFFKGLSLGLSPADK
ncbi:MAG: DAK2 domain-containing protein [Propionibacteriaceae bacterium]|jgi:dihydroxyacetone kinase-like protein|nr:DAK2 domain-containing protein [Propionibacteriaceae bacterium]